MTPNEVKQLITKTLEKVYKDISITWDEDKIDVLFINYGWHYKGDLSYEIWEMVENEWEMFDDWVDEKITVDIEIEFARKMLRK